MAEDMEWRKRYQRGLHRNKTAPDSNPQTPADALGNPMEGQSLPDGKFRTPPAINEQGRAGISCNEPDSDTAVV